MSRGGNYGQGKRQRAAEKARKKREKAERRARKREEGPNEIPVTTAEEMQGDLPSIAEAMANITSPATQRAASVPCRLFVGGLSWDTTEEGLRQAFGKFGTVTDAFIVKDRDTGRSRGFGFVTLDNRKDAAKAIEALHDTELDGRTIAVNVATER